MGNGASTLNKMRGKEKGRQGRKYQTHLLIGPLLGKIIEI
jgi:hypothetical protein